MLSQTVDGPAAALPAAADAPDVESALEAEQIESPRIVDAQRRDAIFRRSLAAADCTAACVSLLAVVAASPSLTLRAAALAALPPAVLAAKLLGLYDRDETLLRKTTLDEMPRLFHLATLWTLVISLAHGLFIAGPYGPADALLLWVGLTLALPVVRVCTRAICLRLAPAERCLVIGDPVTLAALSKRLAGRPGTNAEVVGYLDFEDQRGPGREEDGSRSADEDVLADRLARIFRCVRDLHVHRVIVAPRSADGEDVLDLVRTLRAIGARVSFVPRVLEVLGTSVEFDDVHGITVMGARRFHLSRSSALLKRSFDLVVASLLLLVLSPLMALIAVAIKIESRGRILFRQVRVGRGGTTFDMLKFRTMVANAESLKPTLLELNEAETGFFKMANDPRVTRIGRLLRRSSLDEVPQLINVIRGEMSLVGPRPLVCEEDEQILGWSRRRLALTPGMTGHWQILGSSRVPLPEMVAIDCVYVTTWSLWTDVKILLRTIPHVFRLRGM